MGYARLKYLTDGSVLATTVLHDIVGCITGSFTSTSQLKGAIPASSEIVNTLGENWSFLYPSSGSFVASTPNNTLASWVLSSACVNNTKTKYIRLTNYYRIINGSLTSPTINNTGTGISNQYNLNNSGSGITGILLQACTGATNSTTITRETWYNSTASNSNYGMYSMFTGTNIIVSWSSKHIIIWSDSTGQSGGSYMVMGCLEFPENDVTTAQSLIPFAFIVERNANLGSSITGFGPTQTGNSFYGDVQIPDFYNVPTATKSGFSINGGGSALDISSSTNTIKPSTFIPTINNSGVNKTMMMPLAMSVPSKGFPPLYLSTLTNVYMVPNDLGNGGDSFIDGSNTYAYLPSNSGISFVVKKV